MVFGNLGDSSGTGVCFSRDPSTGERVLYGEFLRNAQGEDVVAGIRTPEPISRMAEQLPEAYRQLVDTVERLERHYGDMQDVEFTVERGALYLLQTRAGKRTAAAAMRVARELESEGVIDARRGRPSRRPEPARRAAAPAHRPRLVVRGVRPRPERVAGRGRRRGRVRRRHRRAARPCGRARDPRPLGDDSRRHPRAAAGAGSGHGARRHDLARRGRRARHGQALRRRRRGRAHRRREPHPDGGRRRRARGRRHHDRRRHGRADPRRGAARRRRRLRGLPHDRRVGRRAPAPPGARERRHARGRRARPLVRAPRASASVAPSTCSWPRIACPSCAR